MVSLDNIAAKVYKSPFQELLSTLNLIVINYKKNKNLKKNSKEDSKRSYKKNTTNKKNAKLKLEPINHINVLKYKVQII